MSGLALLILALQLTLQGALPARVLEGRGERADIAAVLAALPHEPDPARRAELAHFLGRPDLGTAELAQRLDALEVLACADAASGVREAAVAALAESWQRPAWERLDALLERADPQLRPLVARTIGERAHLAPLLVARVRAAAREGQEDPRVLVALLAAEGRALADLPPRAEEPAELRLLVALGRAGDPRVARAARGALEDLFQRLRARAEPARALQLAHALAESGADPDWCARQRVLTALLVGSGAGEALGAAEELVRRARSLDAREGAVARARAAELRGSSLLALGRAAEAQAAAEELGLALERALASTDARGAGLAPETSAELAYLRARAALLELLARLVQAPAGAPAPAMLAAARALHRAALDAQLRSLRAHGPRLATLDALFAEADSPLTLWADDPWRAGGRGERLALEERLGRLLATVAPGELLGFEPLFAPEDPLADPERERLFRALSAEGLADAERRLQQELTRLVRRTRDDPLGPSPAEERELYELDSERRSLQGEPGETPERARARLFELRVPSALALDLARAARDEGQAEEARRLALALSAALERAPAAQRYLWGVELRAEAEELSGNSWSDAKEPARAEAELTRALERLDALEKELEGRGLGPFTRGRLASSRAGVLVGLAVNANVRQHDPARALSYFERAWALRQDEFMKALRTCYLARAGRSDEARGLLREIAPAPGTLYNLACTWALLGDKDEALALLERDFEENLPTRGMRARQQSWARDDPDLAVLRGEPRFEALLAR